MEYAFIDRLKDIVAKQDMHPAIVLLLRYFDYTHLPPKLQEISKPIALTALDMAEKLDGAELTVGLRKLLEAKDCFVRAAL